MKMSLLLLFVSLSTTVYSSIIPAEWLTAEHEVVELNRVKYPMVRVKTNGATPVILLHGLGGNAHNWMEIGSDLSKAGYDVWAFTWTANMDRDIEKSGQKTVKEIVEYVFQKTGKKVFLAGHSLGGVVSKIYSLGIDRKFLSNKLYSNKNLKLHSKKYVLGIVSISSPSGLDSSLEKYIPILSRVPSTPTLGSTDLSKVIKSGNLSRDLHLVKAFELSWSGSRLPLVRSFVRTMFNTQYHSYSNYDLGKLIRYGTAPVSKLITGQIGSDKDQVQTTKEMNHIFHNELDHVPFAYIAGEDDEIAEDNIILNESISQNSPFLNLESAGHMDPLSGDLVSDSVLFMIKFFRETEKY